MTIHTQTYNIRIVCTSRATAVTRAISSVSQQTPESKKEEFRKYLEKSGVIDALTKVLVGLYEEPERPPNAVDYIKRFATQPKYYSSTTTVYSHQVLRIQHWISPKYRIATRPQESRTVCLYLFSVVILLRFL